MADGKSPEEGVNETMEDVADAEDVAKAEDVAGAEDVAKAEDVADAEDVAEAEVEEREVPREGEAEEDPAPEAETEDEPPTVESLSAALSEAETRVAASKDQALRAKADVENMRRRAAREVENAHKYALEKLTRELLPVLDSLEKAVESTALAKDADAIGEGVELSLKMFLSVLTKVGIEQLDPLGEPFNPQFHEAIAMVENPDGEPNSVMEVIQRGYSLNGRLVRAAKVVVVKGTNGEKPAS
ncbi:MAG: nucleotide exchange factor GrpE [Gammaproteobacteria bacterium]|nr:nucleotide exchange factor GrpE [Gammaproteobacteria bacterium]